MGSEMCIRDRDRGEVVHQLNKEEIQSPEELMKLMRDTIKKH